MVLRITISRRLGKMPGAFCQNAPARQQSAND